MVEAAVELETEDRSDSDLVPPGIVLVCAAAVFGCSLVLLVTNSSLVADGSYYVLRAIQTGQPCACAAGRQGINLVREGPLLLAVHGGVTNTHALAVLEGLGFLVFPALVWILAIVYARGSRVRFTLVTTSCALCFAMMIFYSVSELTLALPLVVLASVVLTEPTPWPGRTAVLAIVSTGLLFFSHESIVPCAVLLGVTAVVRSRAHLGSTDTRASMAVLALSVAVLGGAVCTLVLWPNPNSNSFLNLPPSTVLFGMGALCVLGWAVLYGRPFGLSSLRWVLLILAVPCTVNGIRLAIRDGAIAAYWSRGACLTLVVALQLLLLADWIIRLRGTDPVRLPVRLSPGAAKGAAVFLVVLLVVPTVCALRWSTFIGDFRQTIMQHKGIVPESDVPTRLGSSYVIDWTNTTLSVILRSSTNNAVVENATTASVVPFGIDSAEQQIPPAYRWDSSMP
jgi:hypothetical protein